jgi:hypothetical protein
VSAAKLPPYLDVRTAEILARCYRGQAKGDVIARAVRMLATADGHLKPDGTIKTGTGGRPATRRTS